MFSQVLTRCGELVRRSLPVVLLVLLAGAVCPGEAAATLPADGPPVFVVPGPPGQPSRLTLADVARESLGDPGRAREIFALNQKRAQSDGTVLTRPDQPLRSGWTLVLPAGARTGEIRIGPPTVPPPDGTRPVAAARVTILGLPWAIAAGLAAGLLLGAGVVVVLVVIRRRGARDTPDEARRVAPVTPLGQARGVLDRALHQLPQASRPQVYAAVVGPDRVSLRLTPPLPDPPPPWQAREQGAVWEAPIWQLDGPPGDRSADFPLLVPVGTIGGEWTAVNLGRAPGLIAFTGDPGPAAGVVTALVNEIGADPGAAGIAITVVGSSVLPGMNLAAGRVRFAAGLREVLPVAQGAGPGDELWEQPGMREQLVVVVGPVGAGELDQLGAVAGESGNTVAVLVLGDHPNAAWRFEVGAAGALDIGVLGLRLDRP